MNYENELNLLLHMIDAASMQLTMIKDHPKTTRSTKMRLNEYFGFARRFTKVAENDIPAQKKDIYNDRTALVLEIVKEASRAKKPDEALAMLKSYNSGEVIVTD